MKFNDAPDFLIVGAAKSGTTSLFEALGNHPDIYMPPNKEPWFFSHMLEDVDNIRLGPQKSMIITDIKEYKKLFYGKTDSQLSGEASTSYLYDYKNTIRNIKKIIPNYRKIKIIIVLRDPVERAYSHYLNNIRSDSESRAFEKAIEKCLSGTEFRYRDYLRYGLYAEQARAYIDNFNEVKILFFEELIREPKLGVSSVQEFIGVDNLVASELDKENISGIPRVRFISNIIYKNNPLKWILKKIIPKNIRKRISEALMGRIMERPTMSDDARELLANYYSESVRDLEVLVGRKITCWKNHKESK